MTVPRSQDWKIGAREMLQRDPQFRIEMMADILELLTTGNDEDQRVARRMAGGCWSWSLRRTPSCWSSCGNRFRPDVKCRWRPALEW